MKKFKKLTTLATCAILAVSAVPLGASASTPNTQVPNDSISTPQAPPKSVVVLKKSKNTQISIEIKTVPGGIQGGIVINF